MGLRKCMALALAAMAPIACRVNPSPPTPPPPPPPPAPAAVEDDCTTPEPTDVLFVGNSYMITHDLPVLVETLGAQAGVTVRAEIVAEGGKNFEYHVANEETARALQEREFDVVVLQSHSLDPLRNRKGFLEAGEALVEMVRASGAVPVLFETWARKAGHNLYSYYEPTGGSPDAMQRAVSDSYEELSKRTGAEVIAVGRAWRRLRKQDPTLDPYASDKAHPGEAGAYLTANVLFAALTDVSPVGNVEPLLGLEEDDARTLQAHAAAIVEPHCEEVVTP